MLKVLVLERRKSLESFKFSTLDSKKLGEDTSLDRVLLIEFDKENDLNTQDQVRLQDIFQIAQKSGLQTVFTAQKSDFLLEKHFEIVFNFQ